MAAFGDPLCGGVSTVALDIADDHPAPAAAKDCASAAPMPEPAPAPVTVATLPSICMSLLKFSTDQLAIRRGDSLLQA
jgi:hypothetical protein